jgi:arginine/lysine/ornithine decarboxylase
VGIHAAVMATVRPGQALLLARNCHLSAFAACVLAGCQPVWLQPEADALHGVAHCVTPAELAAGFSAARQQGLTVGAVLAVSPTYYGAVAHITGAGRSAASKLVVTLVPALQQHVDGVLLG